MCATKDAGSISVSNDADTFDSTCDGRFTVVVGFSSQGTPVSLVDVDAGSEVAKLGYPNKLARSVAVGDDTQTVLVVLDNAAMSNASTVNRLVLGNGTLTDSGAQLAFAASDFVSKVRIAPGSRVGVALIVGNAGPGVGP